MIVVFTAKAEADLEQIVKDIAQGNPARTVSFVNELLNCCERLTDTPLGFPLVPRYEPTDVRCHHGLT